MARARKKKTGSLPTRRPVRPVLGNDPFVRGAAPRVSPVQSFPSPPSSPSAAAARSTDFPPASVPETKGNRADRPEKQRDQVVGSAEDGLAELARLTGSFSYRKEAQELVARLLPRLRERLFGTVPATTRVFETSTTHDRFGMASLLPQRLAPFLNFLYDSWWRVEVRSPEHLPEGPAVVVANHGGALSWDALILRMALQRAAPPRDLRPLLDRATMETAVFGQLAQRLGAVISNPDNAARLLAEGSLVAVFPEGSTGPVKPWADRYRLQRFGRGGFAKVALRAGAPIVPCAILGSEEASPALSRPGWLAERLRLPLTGLAPGLRLRPLALIPLPSRWSIRFGSSIEVKSCGPAGADDTRLVAELTERTRSSLQRILDEEVVSRRSTFL